MLVIALYGHAGLRYMSYEAQPIMGDPKWPSKIHNGLVSGPRVFNSSSRPNSGGIKEHYSQIQWPVPSINAESVDIFLGEE